MSEDQDTKPPAVRKNILWQFDNVVKKVIPNFNVRAIVYFSVLFATALYLQIWHIGGKAPQKEVEKPSNQETVVADDKYWNSSEYKEKIRTQTVQSFTSDLVSWLQGNNQELLRRKFEDILFINSGLTPLTGGDLASVVPESFNYLENHALARYRYAKDKGFLSDAPLLVTHGKLVCDLDEKTEKATGIELFEWRYASMQKLADFMKTKPDWKMQIGDRILDVSDPRIEDKGLLKLSTAQNQPVGLFSFLIFHDNQSNRIYLADSNILEMNGVDDALTLSRIGSHYDSQPKLYFKTGFEGCKTINEVPKADYGQSN